MSLIARYNGQSVFGNACNTVASPTKNFLAFATPLQVPRKTFWRLQHRCKSHEKLFGVCKTVASPTKNFSAFATLLQVSRKTFWHLQHRCKSQKPLFGPCTDGASTSKNVLAPRMTSVEALCWLYSYIELALRRSARGFDTKADGLDTIQLFVAHTLTDS